MIRTCSARQGLSPGLRTPPPRGGRRSDAQPSRGCTGHHADAPGGKPVHARIRRWLATPDFLRIAMTRRRVRPGRRGPDGHRPPDLRGTPRRPVPRRCPGRLLVVPFDVRIPPGERTDVSAVPKSDPAVPGYVLAWAVDGAVARGTGHVPLPAVPSPSRVSPWLTAFAPHPVPGGRGRRPQPGRVASSRSGSALTGWPGETAKNRSPTSMRRTPDGRSRSGRRHSANGRLPGHSGHAGSGRSSAVTGTHGPASDCRTTGQTRTTDEPPWDAHRSRMDRAWMPGGPCLQRRWTVWTQWTQWTHLWETASQGTMLEWLDVRGMRSHLGTAVPCTATKDVDGRQDPQGPRTPRLSLATPTLQK